MKTSTFLMGAAAAILTGCVVTSVCPYYTENDVVTEPAILGQWANVKNSAETWKFEQLTNFAYRLTLAESSKTTVMETHAFRLQGQLFLDIFSLEQDYHVIPAHYLLKVDRISPSLKLSEMDDEWLKSFLKKKPTAIAYHTLEKADGPGASRIVLTADTSELQSFVMRQLKTPGAWKEAIELRKDITVETAQLKGPL